LVDGKPGAVGRDFEQDAVGLPEVQAAEVVAIDPATVRDAPLAQPADPGRMLLIVRCPKGHMMHAAGSWPCGRQLRLDGDVKLRVRTARAHLEDSHLTLIVVAAR